MDVSRLTEFITVEMVLEQLKKLHESAAGSTYLDNLSCELGINWRPVFKSSLNFNDQRKMLLQLLVFSLHCIHAYGTRLGLQYLHIISSYILTTPIRGWCRFASVFALPDAACHWSVFWIACEFFSQYQSGLDEEKSVYSRKTVVQPQRQCSQWGI